MAYYAVKAGRKPGIYQTWDACRAQVHGYSGALYKKFEAKKDAEAYMDAKDSASVAPTKTSPRKGKRGVPANPPEASPFSPEHIPTGECHAYVDGSFNAKTKVFGYGVVFFTSHGKEIFYGHGKDDAFRHRNIAGEIRGAEKAMELAVERHAKSLTIYHDYAGIRHWALGEWKTNVTLTQEYAKKAATVREMLTLHFVKIAAHTGETYNEEADRLAKKGAGVATGS